MVAHPHLIQIDVPGSVRDCSLLLSRTVRVAEARASHGDEVVHVLMQ
jgi:hypothetical protein